MCLRPVKPPANYFSSLITANNLVYVTGFDQGVLFYDPNGLPFLNTLDSLVNSFGYWVRVLNPTGGGSYRVAGKYGINPSPIYDFFNGTTNLPNEAIGGKIEIQTQDGTVHGAMEILKGGYAMTTPIYGDDPSTAAVEGVGTGERLIFVYGNKKADPGVYFSGNMDVHKLNLQFQHSFAWQIYPNPFERSISIQYDLDEEAEISIEIYDAAGRRIAELVNEYQYIDTHLAKWKAKQELPEGVYYVQLSLNGVMHASERIVLIR